MPLGAVIATQVLGTYLPFGGLTTARTIRDILLEHRRSSLMSESQNPLEPSRRSFLKSTGFAAAAVMAPVAMSSEAQAPTVTQHASTKGARLASPVTLVNILQGTDSTPSFSRGNTLPIAARPFGMAHWTLQTTPSTPWMFQPGQRRVQGFRSTHQ